MCIRSYSKNEVVPDIYIDQFLTFFLKIFIGALNPIIIPNKRKRMAFNPKPIPFSFFEFLIMASDDNFLHLFVNFS